MLELDLKIGSKQNWFLGSKSFTIDATFTPAKSILHGNTPHENGVETIPVAALLELFLRYSAASIPSLNKLRAEQIGPEFLLTDIRGRQRAPEDEELFFIEGVVFDPATESEGAFDIAQLATTPFVVRLKTAFESFSGSRHIVHTLTSQCSGPVSEIFSQCDLLDLLRIAPARIDRARIGLEFFAPQFRVLLGYAPVVVHSVFIDASPKRVSFGAERQKQSFKSDEHQRLFDAFDRALRELALFGGFAERIAAQLSP